MKLWDPIRGIELARMQGHAVTSSVWRGARTVSGWHRLEPTNLVITWDASTGQRLTTMHGHTTWVESVAWSPDGTRLASASLDNTVRISDPSTGEETLVLRGNSVWFHDVSWHPDGARLAAASSDGQIWIWDATRGFERDTTPRACPLSTDRSPRGRLAARTSHWYAESYIRAGKPAEAFRLWAEALSRDPKLGDDRLTVHRYNAALRRGPGRRRRGPA